MKMKHEWYPASSEWGHIYYHSMFQQILDDFIAQVEELKASNPTEYTRKNAYKRLQAILKLVMYSILKI